MLKSDFYFDLPPELIAQTPAVPRDSARLMLLKRCTSNINHCIFNELTSLLKPNDVLVVNDTKVLPARLLGQKKDTGGACQLLLLRETSKDEWECLAKPGGRMKPGTILEFGDGTLTAEILSTLENGAKIVRFRYDSQTLHEKLDEFGRMPLPPYIQSQQSANNDYQTVYAKSLGSAAAPTAGLHFTNNLIDALKTSGVSFASITLHVGLGTFRPVQEDNIEDHPMHSEWYSIDENAASTIKQAKQCGGRIIAVGTTSCRTLESVVQKHGEICPSSGDTDIFIYPGYSFKAIDGLITNFHLPESTLIMLVSAFHGRENTLNAYNEAINEKYNFFSFGDAMLIL